MPSLLAIYFRTIRLRLRGAKIGHLTVIAPAEIDGNIEFLEIANGSFIGRVHIALHAGVRIGKCVVVSDFATLLTGTHSLTDPEWSLIALPIHIGDYAWVGQGAMILPGVTIGNGAVVGAGAVVTQNVDPYSIVVGNPARALDTRRTPALSFVPVERTAAFGAWLGTNRLPPSTI